MLEFLDNRWKEYQKNCQKVAIRFTGFKSIHAKNVQVKTIKKGGKSELEIASHSISKSSTGLKETVKGQFGSQITNILETQQQTLKSF